MSGLARQRLVRERKDWRKESPYGFYARPLKKADGSVDIMSWTCGIPGPKNSPWEGGLYKLEMKFPSNYPAAPPKCAFSGRVLFHPNIYPSGAVCLSILNAEEEWKPSITLKHILLGIQALLIDPNPDSPAQHEPMLKFRDDKTAYDARIRKEVQYHLPQ
jgi:ubiquitin-conjugating enzyme E2 I